MKNLSGGGAAAIKKPERPSLYDNAPVSYHTSEVFSILDALEAPSKRAVPARWILGASLAALLGMFILFYPAKRIGALSAEVDLVATTRVVTDENDSAVQDEPSALQETPAMYPAVLEAKTDTAPHRPVASAVDFSSIPLNPLMGNPIVGTSSALPPADTTSNQAFVQARNQPSSQPPSKLAGRGDVQQGEPRQLKSARRDGPLFTATANKASVAKTGHVPVAPERFRPDCARRGRGDLPAEQGASTRHGKSWQGDATPCRRQIGRDRQHAKAESALIGGKKADKDVDLIAALLSHIGGTSTSGHGLAKKAGSVQREPATITKARNGDAPAPGHDIVLHAPGETVEALVRRCQTLGFFEGQLCRLRICSGQWGKDAACPASSLDRSDS